MTQPKKDNNFFTEWLEKLQQESWQLELLISGLALYGVFESKTLLIDFHAYISLYTEGIFKGILMMLYQTFWVGWRLFLINLLIHIILRGLWIGAIGLRYVSGDIDFNELNYSKLFTKYLKKKIGSYDSFIEKLEKICSVLFAYTFLLFLLFFSFILYFGFFVIFIPLLESVSSVSNFELVLGISGFIYLIIGLLVFIDLITLGGFKKIKETSVSKVYFVIYRFVSLITLSFLYRPLLYNFLDQKYTKRLFILSVPYIFLIAFSGVLFNNNIYTYMEDNENLQEKGFMVDDRFYQDFRDRSLKYKDKSDKKEMINKIPYIVLDKYYMDNPYPSLFLKMTKSDKVLLGKNKSIAPIFKEGIQFTLFNSGKSKRVEDLSKDVMQTTVDSLFAKKRSYRASKRKAKRLKNTKEESLLKDKIDAIDKVIEITRAKLNKNKQFAKKANYSAIMNAFIDFVDIKIDNVNYKDSLKCKYYIHPSTGHKGFLCHFSSDSITKGYHELSFERIEYSKRNKSDSTSVYKAILPFIKIK
jgi:hypothetical protein